VVATLGQLRSQAIDTFLSLRNLLRVLKTSAAGSVRVGPGLALSTGALLRGVEGGRLEIGRNVSIGRHVQIVARSGGLIRIGDRVSVGQGSIIIAHNEITIEADTMLAEYVTVHDQDHVYGQGSIQCSGFLTSPVHIGVGVWIGAKASILRGVTIGDRAVIGAHALVRSDVPPECLSAGIPARILKASLSNAHSTK